jgi:hypothetical protein
MVVTKVEQDPWIMESVAAARKRPVGLYSLFELLLPFASS